MSKQLKLRRGTTIEHSTFTGALAEVTVDTDKNVVIVHNGVTAGGIPQAKDSSVVHNTGNETISGTKTFSSTIQGSISGSSGSCTGNAATATSAGNADTLDGQHGSYYQPASTAITTSNIGSQSVNYATSSGSAGNGGVTSVNGMTGAVTLSTGGVTSLNGQTGAIVNTNIDAIGSIVKAAYIVRLGTPQGSWANYFLNAGTAVAGSNLRYNPSVVYSSEFTYLDLYWEGYSSSPTWSNYGGGGTSLSGTWRCLGRIMQYVNSSWGDVGEINYWYTTGCYFVRVS